MEESDHNCDQYYRRQALDRSGEELPSNFASNINPFASCTPQGKVIIPTYLPVEIYRKREE